MSDEQKNAVIMIMGYGAAAFAGASVGAEVSKLDGAIGRNPELWHGFTGTVTESHHETEHHNLVSYGDLFGPLALGTIAGVALLRKLTNAIANVD